MCFVRSIDRPLTKLKRVHAFAALSNKIYAIKATVTLSFSLNYSTRKFILDLQTERL